MSDLQVINAKTLAKSEAINNKFQEILGENSKYFIQSVVNAVSTNNKLLSCDGKSVWGAAMNAAILGLPVDNNLSYSAIVPYGNKAQFQIMTKGYVQLAIDSGLYKSIHVTEVYEDELIYYDYLKGEAHFTDSKNWKQREEGNTNKIVGYFAYFELINGFAKGLYMTTTDVTNHAKTYSKSYTYKDSIWKLNPIAMGKKTVLKNLLRSYGKLGRGSMLHKAIEVDQGFTENFDTDNTKYYDNPAYEEKEDTENVIEGEIIVDDEFAN